MAKQDLYSQPEGAKHGACFCSSVTNLSIVQELTAKTVTSLLTLLTMLYVAPFLLIGISIFKLSDGTVMGGEKTFIF